MKVNTIPYIHLSDNHSRELQIQRLAIACIVVTLVRIVQDMVQVFDSDIIGGMKKTSQIDDNMAWYPIFL